jgi:sugar phosphate permease
MSRRWAIFAITSLSFFLSQFYRASNAVIAPQLIRDLSIDTQGLGFISASFFYAFALTQIPISILLDKVGPRRIMTVLSFVGALGAGPYLMEVIGLSAIGAGNPIFFMNVGLILGGPTWGAFSDGLFRSRKKIVISGLLSLFFIMLSLTMLSQTSGLWVLVLLFFSFGLFRSSGLLMYVHIKELMPNEMAGAAMTGINFFTMIGPAVFLQGLGRFMQHFYPHAPRGHEAFNAAFLLCAACLAGTILLYLLTQDTRIERRRSDRSHLLN